MEMHLVVAKRTQELMLDALVAYNVDFGVLTL